MKRQSKDTEELDRDTMAWVETMYAEHSQKIFRVCLRMAAGDRQWALDRVHDAFTRFIEQAGSLRDHQNPMGWLYRVAVNICIAALRRQHTVWRYLPRLRSVGGASVKVDMQVCARRALCAFERAIADLPDKERVVMTLVHLENHSQDEAAKLLGLSKGQVSKIHTRALDRLRALDWEVDHV